jgi:putative ABC transport system ATP-binding protein
MTTIITTKDVTKTYNGKIKVEALAGIDLEIRAAEFVVIAGPSGSGKSTLLHLLGGLDTPTSGSIRVAGHDLTALSKNRLSDFRLSTLGFIFQAYNLLPVLTLEENVEFGLLLKGTERGEIREKVRKTLQELGIEEFAHQRPSELSGGQQQRGAIARAIVGDPELILADEPTANLDSHNAGALIDMMRKMNEGRGKTFVVSSHDPMVIAKADRVVRLRDGKIVS